MKKLILLSAAGLLVYGADAQQANQSVVRHSGDVNARKTVAAPAASGSMLTQSRIRPNAKVTATPFYTETFASGSVTGVPAGWSVTAGAGINGTWKWMNTASTSTYTTGALNSTTKADGWMIYDSDSIGDKNSVLPLTGTLVSPVINCSTHASVLLTFQELYRMFRDSTYVDVSRDGGVTWPTTYVYQVNGGMSSNGSTANPELIRLNITAAAANQANVKIRFRYIINANSGAGGAYAWMVDDIAIAELDPVELGINNSAMHHYLGTVNEYATYSLFSNYPASLIDSVLPITYITNNGLNSISNAPLNQTTFRNGAQVFTSSTTFPVIPAVGVDSIMDWAGFYPTQTGNYVTAFSVGAPGDAFPDNDVDTQRYNITDTVLTTYGARLAGGYYLHRPASAGEISYQQGSRFDIADGETDTLTSVSVCFGVGTSTNVNTVAQLYRVIGTSPNLSWDPVATMRSKNLTASDISTSNATAGLVFTNYYVNTQAAGSIAPFILGPGSYAIVVKTLSAPSGSTVLLNCAEPIIDRYNVSGYFGHIDSNDESTIFNFAPGRVSTGTRGIVPMIRMNFGKFVTAGPGPGSVATINGVTIGDAFPNPANNTVSVPVSATAGATVNVTLSNMMGQVLQTQSLGNIGAGQRKTAVFNTSALAAGIYLYTVESNGERVSNRMVVAH